MFEKVLREMEAEMPPLVSRTHPKFREWTGIGGRTMANLDSLGQGPEQRLLLGREIAYPRQSLLAWISRRLKVVPTPARNVAGGVKS
jgi:hypothetical protein